jgi:uncharacterized protein YeaO (DUF488 family)
MLRGIRLGDIIARGLPIASQIWMGSTRRYDAAWEDGDVIKTKSVQSPIEREKDGLRVLVARFRGRGLPTDRYDVWMPSLGPSEELLRGILAGEITWAVFGKRYLDELFESGAIDQRNHTIKNHGQKFTLRLLNKLAASGTVTLLCHCPEEQKQCHRHLLQKLLQRRDLAAR